MKCNAAGMALIKKYEGCKLTAYLCPAGLVTVGWGHVGPEAKLGTTITQAYADDLFKADLAHFETAVRQCVTAPLTDNQFSALVCFAYNVKGWRESTLVRKLNQKDYAGAASEWPKWDHCAGRVLPGLTARRHEEQTLFLTP